MKILFYYYMGGGGGFSNIILLLRTLARLHPEDDIEIITSPLAPFDELLQDMPNIRIRRFRMTGLKEIDRLLLGVCYLPKIARETKADILWSMNLGPYVKTTGLPLVLSMNNHYQVCPWEATRYHPGNLLHVALLRWFFRHSLRISDAVVVQTHLMGDYIRRIRGASRVCVAPKSVEQAIDVHPEPLPPFLLSALERGLGRGTFTFLYVSTYTPHKNHVTLIKVFTELARRDVRVRVILTVKPEEILNIDRQETVDLIKSGYIVPVGWVEKPYLKSLYEACDACLMPSVLESLSSTHLEAMKWELPQIVADNVYAHEICGPNALYVREDDARAWVEQIERLMGDESLRHELIHAGHEQMKRFPASWDEASETVHRILKLIKQNPNCTKEELMTISY